MENLQLSEREKSLLTLLCDKINNYGYMIGAHRNSNWHTNTFYNNSKIQRMQGTIDRIGKVTYHKSPHVTHNTFIRETGLDFYDHNIRCHWREFFGMGDPNPSDILKSCMEQDKTGNWHFPCDEGIWISLWHPNQQSLQEKIGGHWNNKEHGPDWRPRYDYKDFEVINALKIMAEEFDWEFEIGSDMTTISI